jgi:hypothetical protein
MSMNDPHLEAQMELEARGGAGGVDSQAPLDGRSNLRGLLWLVGIVLVFVSAFLIWQSTLSTKPVSGELSAYSSVSGSVTDISVRTHDGNEAIYIPTPTVRYSLDGKSISDAELGKLLDSNTEAFHYYVDLTDVRGELFGAAALKTEP